ncbi:MAG: class I tRNA ligase family protein [Candidatus Paceibacterota bacterium]
MKEEESNKSEVVQKEEKILDFWQKNKIFEKTLEKENPEGNFVFFDGPPFATGLPHYGHILPGTVKDLIPRYQTMKGKKVLRRWGWDCHGLPIENLIEKELGLSSKRDIEKYGVEKFNLAARNAVFRYRDEWKKIIPRSGRWVDMENDYRTMDSTYTESVWWSFKNLYDKKLIYKDFKTMHICPHCETTLSNLEVSQGYKDITDISVYVKVKLLDEENTFALIWTTTPWTLPGNVALAVNPDFDYVKAKKGDVFFILLKDLALKVLKDNYEIVDEFKGKKLVGKSYEPIFSYYKNSNLDNLENAWKIYDADFVDVETGTGIVHIASAFGEDDMNLGKKNELPFIQHVGMDGTFKEEVSFLAGQKVKPIEDHQKSDVEIIKYLAKEGSLFAKEKIIHSYPHCWRCATPLLNYATSSWFVKVTLLKDKMIDLNNKINWKPAFIGEGRFGNWLEGARDWSISRGRFWGAPLPVWENESEERFVIGSVEDLKNYIGRKNKYFLMRHAESEDNAHGNLINSKDTTINPLTEEGISQAKASVKNLKDKKIDLIIHSPFLRTKQTSQIIAEELGIPKESVLEEEKIVELQAGEYDRKSWEEFIENFSSIKEKFEKNIGEAESWEDVRKRSMSFIYDIDSKYEGKNILIVSHGAPLNLIMMGSRGFSTNQMIKYFHSDIFSNAEIKECDFVSLPHNEKYEIDLHRPYIDDVVLKDKKGNLLKRVPEVFDTWYDSGSMSFAQQHYPFENKELFESKNNSLFPADFIAEGLDQTRGWFYTLLVLGTGLFNKSPYNSVIVNGLVLAEDGRKMSKSLKNYPDPMDIINKYGADALRYYLMSSSVVRTEDLNFSEKGVDEIYKKLIQKIYNVLSFYQMYSTDYVSVYEKSSNVLDQWIVYRLKELLDTVTKHLDSYEIEKAARPIMDFVEDLSTWYIRRSRERFKSDNFQDRKDVSDTTSYILKELSKIMAPITPFIAEEVYLEITKGLKKESVHLEKWPNLKEIVIDQNVLDNMSKTREIVSKALDLRQASGIKVRQPLASLIVEDNLSEEFFNIIADEVNVKKVSPSPSPSQENFEMFLDTNITDDLFEEGLAREIIREIQDLRKKENFDPNQKVKIKLLSDKKTKNIFDKYLEMISKVTLVSEVEYEESDERSISVIV